jgi:hypothetical protein
MNAGLPGTGIGGFFYLLSAVFMLFAEIYNTIRGRSSWKRWKLVGTQLFIVSGIIFGIGIAIWIITLIFPVTETDLYINDNSTGGNIPGILKYFKAAPFLISLITLFAVIGIIETIRFSRSKKPAQTN